MLSWCERRDVGYIIGLAGNTRLHDQASMWMAWAKAGYEHTGEKQRLFAELRYGARSWGKRRRVIDGLIPTLAAIFRMLSPSDLASITHHTGLKLLASIRSIERGRPGPGLLAHVLVSKYGDHLPLYRQSQIYNRDGVDLDRSTLADWVGKSTALLERLAAAIGDYVQEGQALFADDTPVKLLAPGSGKTKTARLWAYVRDERPWAGAGHGNSMAPPHPKPCL
jgi:hypothetical protein